MYPFFQEVGVGGGKSVHLKEPKLCNTSFTGDHDNLYSMFMPYFMSTLSMVVCVLDVYVVIFSFTVLD